MKEVPLSPELWFRQVSASITFTFRPVKICSLIFFSSFVFIYLLIAIRSYNGFWKFVYSVWVELAFTFSRFSFCCAVCNSSENEIWNFWKYLCTPLSKRSGRVLATTRERATRNKINTHKQLLLNLAFYFMQNDSRWAIFQCQWIPQTLCTLHN